MTDAHVTNKSNNDFMPFQCVRDITLIPDVFELADTAKLTRNIISVLTYTVPAFFLWQVKIFTVEKGPVFVPLERILMLLSLWGIKTSYLVLQAGLGGDRYQICSK